MKDKERRQPMTTCHLLIAIRRKKENKEEDMTWRGELCFRQVVTDYEEDLATLTNKIQRFPGVWRIYKTTNARDISKARKMLMTKLINEPEEWDYRVDSLWRTCLLQPDCKAERNFLLDIDTKDEVVLEELAPKLSGKVLQQVETPNGWHIVAEKFDVRALEGIKDVEFKRDGYVFVDRIEVK